MHLADWWSLSHCLLCADPFITITVYGIMMVTTAQVCFMERNIRNGWTTQNGWVKTYQLLIMHDRSEMVCKVFLLLETYLSKKLQGRQITTPNPKRFISYKMLWTTYDERVAVLALCSSARNLDVLKYFSLWSCVIKLNIWAALRL